VEHWNAESGKVWIERLTGHFRKNAWLNPSREDYWRHTHSIDLLRQIMENRMYPMTLSGLDDLTRELSH
jgi:uncharacterized protein with von Willebrand factor type A (vWA) domain